MISHILLTQPAVEPVELQEVKDHARISHNEDDVLLAALLVAARQWCEHYTRRAFIEQVWDLALSLVPQKRYISLPRAPLIEVQSVQLFDDLDNLETWPAENYYSDAVREPGRLVLRNSAAWPDAARCANGMVISYKCGYGANGEDVPEPIKLAIKQLVLHWYEYRGDAVCESFAGQAPLTIEALLDPYRIISFGGLS